MGSSMVDSLSWVLPLGSSTMSFSIVRSSIGFFYDEFFYSEVFHGVLLR